MSEDAKPESSLIDDALAELASLSFPEPTVCVGWVLVSEWLDGDSKYFTMTLTDAQNPSWRSKGLMRHAIDEWGNDDITTE